jgi:transcriptional regulator with XRE-family HTH domain
MTAKSKLSDQLRAAIRDSGNTVNRIAEDCGIAQPHLHYFLIGKRGLGLEKMDKLAEYLQLELRKKVSKKPKTP